MLAVAAAAFLAGCGDAKVDRRALKDDSANLRALKDDPLARYEPPGGRLIHSRESNEGSALGKPHLAEYTLMFELPPGDPEKQMQHAVNAGSRMDGRPLWVE